MKRKIDGSLFRCIAIAMLPTVLAVGCATTSKVPQGDLRSTSGDPLDYDPSRALLRLSEIKPAPQLSRATPGGDHPLARQAARRLRRARKMYESSRFTEATLELEKALRQDPLNPRLHRALALVLYASDNLERARTHLAKALAQDEDDIVTHYLLGRVASEDGDYEAAIRHFRVANLASNAQDEAGFPALCHFHLAKALNAERYLTAAIEEYRAYEAAVAAAPTDGSIDPELKTLLQINRGRADGPISVAYEKLGRYGQAADALSRSVETGQVDIATRERLAHLLTKADRFDEALEQARQLLDDGHAAIHLLFDIHAQAGNPQRALDDLRALYHNNPDRIPLLIAYVDGLERFERLEEAEDILRQATVAHPLERAINWRLADVLRQQGKWEGVMNTLAAALRSDPQVYDTARNKALELAEPKEAVDALLGTVAEPVSATDFATAYLFGSLADGVGRHDQAEKLYARALEFNPSFTPARVEFGEVLRDRFEWQRLIDLVSPDIEQLRSDHRLQRLAALGHIGLDQFDKAERLLGDALRADRTDTKAMQALAGLHVETGEIRRALRQYEGILKLNPLHELSREKLVRIYLGIDRHGDAAEQLAQLKRRAASPHRIARCEARLEIASKPRPERPRPDWDRYREVLTEAIEFAGPDPDTLHLIGSSYRIQWRPNEALEPLKEALKIDPTRVATLLELDQVYRQSLEYEKAADALRRLLKRHPRRNRWILKLLEVYYTDHRFPETFELATEQLRRTDLTDEHRTDFRSFAISALGRLKQYDQQIALLVEWCSEPSADAAWTTELVRAYQAAERYDDAVTLARAWHEQNPQVRDAVGQLVVALVRADRHEQARQLLLEELERDPLNGGLHETLIRLLVTSERYDDALELLDNAMAWTINESGVRDLRHIVLAAAGRRDDQIKLLTTWLREVEMDSTGRASKNPDELKREIALALIAAGRYDEAITKLNRWISETEFAPNKYRFLRALSECYQRRDQPQKVIEVLDRAYALKDKVWRNGEGAVRISNDLGYSLADVGMRMQQAERMIRYALAKSPANGAYLDSYGWVLYKRGAFAEAAKWLRKAVNSPGGDDPVVYDHLGDAHWRLGDEDEALRHWNTAMELTAEQLAEEDRSDSADLLRDIQGKIEASQDGTGPQVAPLAPNQGTAPNEPTAVRQAKP